MNAQNGLSPTDKAAKCGTPQTRHEIEEMLAQCEPSDVTAFLRRWLDMEEEFQQLKSQEGHVRDTLGDKLLGNILFDRASQMRDTLLRRASDLARMPACQASDIGAKVYVISRIEELGGDHAAHQGLCRSVLDDVKGLDISVERFSGDR